MNNGVSNGKSITTQNIQKNGIGSSTKNLNDNANKTAVNIIFNLTPLKNESTTFFEALAPAYLNALMAKTIWGIKATIPPVKTDVAYRLSHINQVMMLLNNTTNVINIICCFANLRPIWVSLFFILLLYSKPKKFIKHKKKTTKLNRYLKITFSGEHQQ
tara:strand:+ start:729 stop:1205 length:477 start_codon:yes stop_codon:yes gene_type:complete